MASAMRLAVHTARVRIICMSMSGAGECSSASTHSTRVTAEATSSSSTTGAVQPDAAAELTPRRRASNHAVSRTTGSQLIRSRPRAGDSGTSKWAATAARTTAMPGSQNSAR